MKMNDTWIKRGSLPDIPYHISISRFDVIKDGVEI